MGRRDERAVLRQVQRRLDSRHAGLDGESLFVAGMRDVLVCLDARDRQGTLAVWIS